MKKIVFVLVLLIFALSCLSAKTTVSSDSGSLTLTSNGKYQSKFSGNLKVSSTDNAVNITANEGTANFTDENELQDIVITGDVMATMRYKFGNTEYKLEASADTIINKNNQAMSLVSKSPDSWIRITSLDKDGSTVIIKATDIFFDGISKITASGSPQVTSKLKDIKTSETTTVNGIAKTITATLTNTNSIIKMDGNSRLTSKSDTATQNSDIKANSITIYPNATTTLKNTKQDTTYANANGNVIFKVITDNKTTTNKLPQKQLWQGNVNILNFNLKLNLDGKEEQVLDLTGVKTFSLIDRDNQSGEPFLNIQNVGRAYINLNGNEWGIIRNDK